MRFCAAEEVMSLANSAGEWRGFVLLAAYGGLRIGEVCGLQLRDVDFLRRRVTVNRTLSEVGGRLLVGPPKGRYSRRCVNLPKFVVDELARGIDPDADPGDFLFRYRGKEVRPSWFRKRVWRPVVAAAGLQGLRFHDLRHTAAALAIAAGAHPKVLQERLGHHSAAFTLDRYGHLIDTLDQELADRLDRGAQVTAKVTSDGRHA
ncbi:MAG TPA: site-specific integrase [Actinomycetota bacterium]|nr:site-specific integrase [Actinomycetota bacterium]